MTEVTVACDLRTLFGPARDQGCRPTCAAFAASDAHAAMRTGWEPLSCEYVYHHAVRRDGGCPEEGATLRSVLEAVEIEGQPCESGWPYLDVMPDELCQWHPPANVGELFRRRTSGVAPALNMVKAVLDSGTPAIVGMTVSDAFYEPDAEGIIDTDEPEDPTRRHAIIAVGRGRRGNRGLILVRNSWGDEWGLNGYAWIAESYLAPRLRSVAVLKEAA